MPSVNKVILVGNLGEARELRGFANGDRVCNLRLATTDLWKGKASGKVHYSGRVAEIGTNADLRN